MSALAPVRARATSARARLHVPAPRSAPARPALRLVPHVRSSARRLPFAVLVGAILASGLVGLLMLHTLAAQDAFTLHALQRHTAALADTEQQLSVADQQAAAPSELATRARALGLVPARSLKIVKRRNGTVVAVASAGFAVAVAPAKPASTPRASPAATSAKPAAKPSAKPALAPSAQPSAKPTARHRPH